MRDDLERAERQYRQAVKLQDDFAEAWFNLSFVTRARGNEATADEALSKALALKPELKVHLTDKGK
jgi:Flp pilus assembly protein TadD